MTYTIRTYINAMFLCFKLFLSVNFDSISFLFTPNHIGDVGSSLSHVKPKTMTLVFDAFPLSMQLQVARRKTGCSGIMILYLSGATCLSVDYCFGELAL